MRAYSQKCSSLPASTSAIIALNRDTGHINREVVLRIAQGDEQAFAELFYHFGAIVHPIVLKLVKDPVLAEDVVAEVFMKLWLIRHKLPEIDNLAGYIYRLTTNSSINQLRRNKNEDKVLQQLYLDVPGGQNTVEHNFSAKELRANIRRIVLRLPPQRRRIYELSREQGLSRQEIAAIMEISEFTVRNQLHSALQQIQAALLKEYGFSIMLLFFLKK